MPASGAFTVTVDGIIHGLSSSDRFVAGRTVTLTLVSEVAHDENDVKVRYTKPNQKPLRDPRGNEVVTFGAQPVTNDHTAQTVFVSATVKGSTLDIVLNRVIPGDPVDDAVRLYVNGALHPEVDDYYSGASLGYILTPPVKAHDTVTVSFVKPPPGQPQLVDIKGNEVASYSNKPVVNITPDTEPPVLTGAVARGTALTLVFNEDLDTVAAPPANAFSVAGPATPPTVDEAAFHPTDDTRVVLTLSESVARGDAATVSYVKPGSDPLRDLDENEVVAFTEPVTFTSSPPPPGVQPPPPAATAPSFGSAAVAALALDRGRAMAPVVLPRATGGDGELTYSLTSAPAGLAGLDFDAATRRLSGTPGSLGRWTFTYRAEDADDDRTDSDAAVLTFDVRVAARDQAATAAVKRTLAAVATRTLSSALGHIGLRLTGVLPTGALTLAGRRLEFAAPGMGVEGAGGACAWGGFDRYGLDRYGFDRHGLGPPRRHGLGSGGGCEGWSRGIETDELLRASAFSWLLGAAEGSGGADPAAARWAVWGRGDFSDFAGRPEGMSYDGKARSGWLGVDARKDRWVAGLALSHGVSEADYSYGGGAAGGRLETTLTAFYPYGRWTLAEGLEVRGVLGAGSGEARHMPEDAEAATSDLTMRMGSAGVRRELAEVFGIELAARADASLVRMEIGAGPEFIGGVSADSWRARVGLEATRRLALGEETALTPFMEVAGRRDGGDGLEGSGLEVAGGVRYTAPRVEVEARGRLLAAHAEEGARERGVSVTARLGPGARGRGLSLSLRPRWGAGTGGAEALWRDELPGLSEAGEEAALEARVGYGVGLAERGLLTPFVEAGMSKGRRLRVGTRFDGWRADLGMELSGERREGGNGEAEHGVLLDLRLRF